MWPIFYCQVILRLSTDLLRLANRDQYSMHSFFHILHDLKFEGHKSYVSWCIFSSNEYILYQLDNLDKYFVMCRVEENVPDLSYWSQFDCFFYTKLNEI